MNHIQYKISKANWIGHIWRKEFLKILKHVTDGKRQGRMGQEDEEEEMGSCWMPLRKGEDIVNSKRKQ